MKKLFTLLTLLVAIVTGAWGATGTEKATNTGTKDTQISGTSYSIAGTYIAGAGVASATGMSNNGVKFRTGNDGARIVFTVNDGYTITDFKLYGVSNYDLASGKSEPCISVTKVEVDGVETAFTGTGNFPAKGATNAGSVLLSNISATTSIAIYFDNTNTAGTQINGYYELSWNLPDSNEPLSTTVSPASSTIYVTQNTTLTGSFTGGEFEGEWVSDNESVATVSNTGVVTGISAGTANITYQWKDDQSKDAYKASATVTVKNPDPIGTANSLALDISQYETINLTNAYSYSNNTLVVNANQIRANGSTQKWMSYTDAGGAQKTWNAIGVFKGSSFYNTGSSNNAVSLRSGRTYSLTVTNCEEISALVLSGGSSKTTITIKMDIYEMDDYGLNKISETPVASNSTTSTSEDILTASDLDKSKVYQVVFTSTHASSNSYVYEVAFVAPSNVPTITTQPQSASYVSGAAASALSVAATASAGNLSYQWKSCTDANKTGAADIEGEISSTYTPSTELTGTFYYYCTVTDENGSTDSEVATITVEDATAPEISLSGTSYSTTKGTAVTFTATTTGVPTPTVTWYQSGTETTSGGTEKGTGSTFNPDVTTKGTFYYYAIASNSQGNATSEVITLTVTDPNKVVSGNSYYIEENETPVPDESIICNDITMTFVNGKAGESFTESVEDNHINDINSNYQYSISGSSGNNGWKAQFAPTVSGILKVGVIINNNKTFSITNVTSFSYQGYNNKETSVSETVSSNSLTTGSSPDDKLYVEVAINVEAGTEYAFSVAGSKMGFYGFEFTPGASVSVGAKGFATYCNADYALDFTDKSIQAYTVSSNGASLTLTKKQKVAKGEPVLLYSKTASDIQMIPAIAESEASADNTNKLVAGNGTPITWTDNNPVYILYTGGATPGFYRAKNSTVAANKAYLNLGAAGARAVSFILNMDDSITAISEVATEEDDKSAPVYDLQGRRVAQPAKGLYIVNGKKVIIK